MPLDNNAEVCYTTQDRLFWLSIREALLIAVRAIETRLGLEHSHQTKREQGRRD